MENLLFQTMQNAFLQKTEVQKAPEEKQENELETGDRLHLINKKMQDSFLLETFLDILQQDSISLSFEGTHMNQYVIEDIELLGDHFQNEEKGIFSKINHTKTKMGEMILQKILISPIYDIEILKRRQKLIMDIGRISPTIRVELEKIRKIENELVWFWNDGNMRHIDMMNDLIYFNYDFIPFLNLNEVLNKNERALYISNMYKIIASPLLVALTPLISLLVPLIIFMITQKRLGMKMSFGQIIQFYFKTVYQFNPMEMFMKPSMKTMMVSFMSKAFYVFMYFQNVYYAFQSAKSTHQMINIMHDKLNKIAQYIEISGHIRKICDAGGIRKIDTFFKLSTETRIEEEMKETKDIFQSKTFTKDPSLLSHKGHILKAFQEFRQKREKLQSCFQYIANIDAICSIYELIRKSTDENPYCFTEYFENKTTPHISIKKVWHPYLTQEITKQTVKNDMNMKHHVLITGPNAAGKSTFIKAMIVNILFAQTICMNSAKDFKLTPFRMIETYLHIPDSKGSQSLFEAEMYRSRDYLEKLKEYEKNEFSFIVLDEIFSSTNYVEGFSGAYAILKKISTFKNTLSMTTTHYSDLECLEKDTKGSFENYKFEVTHNQEGEIEFNYELKRGTSRQYIALELLKKNGFDEDLIESAIEMSKKIFVHKKGKKKVKTNLKKEKTNIDN